jgi:hypothetical protein
MAALFLLVKQCVNMPAGGKTIPLRIKEIIKAGEPDDNAYSKRTL